MENIEVMQNEEVTNVVEEAIVASGSNSLKYVAGGAAVVGLGYLFVTKVAKPAYDKFKAKKEAKREAEELNVTIEDFEGSIEK